MKQFFLTALVLLFAIVWLAACGTERGLEPGAAEDEVVSHGGPVTDYVSLVDALRAAGATVEPVGTGEAPLFQAEEQVISVNGGQVQVYEFESAEAAAEAAATVSGGGTIVGTTTVDWVEPPHFYQEGGLIVLYAGDQEEVLTVLEDVLGEPFAVGQAMFPGSGEAEETAVSDGGPVTEYVTLTDTLRAAGARVEPAGTVAQPFFEPAGQVIKVNGEDVQVFEFASREDASAAAESVSPDGSTVGTTMATWVATPHFYRQAKLIVLYVGDSSDVTGVLEEVLGPQFAGG